ncbi:MAG: 5-(carboxyamino)imidazole ribonucleotide synthase [Hydrogenophilus sp.]|nr:5-(carboxyamino)imidazole ribonucleotide synthase [Hydrogenophilus sp.]
MGRACIRPPATLAVLGGGQLGRFFVRAAQELGYRVWVLDPDPEAPAGTVADRHLVAPYEDREALREIARECSAATTEFENVPASALAFLAERIVVHPSPETVALAQDRRSEKRFLREAGLPVAPFAVVEREEDLAMASMLRRPLIVKTARFGYDGKGQVVVQEENVKGIAAAWRLLGGVPVVAEEQLPLQAECSVILARDGEGGWAAFPVAENVHERGILARSRAPAALPASVTERAVRLAVEIAERLDYVGVLGVEFFVVEGGDVVVNELAPRPHNSGHFTLDACTASQFEQQVRALCGLPLARVWCHLPAVMVNLLGDLWFDERGIRREPPWERLLEIPGAVLHLYGKNVPRPRRKMGHVTVVGENWREVEERVGAVERLLGGRGQERKEERG